MVSGGLFLASPLFVLGTNYVLSGFVLAGLGLLLVPVGMVGFHALQGRSYGRIGRGGFWLAVVGALVLAVGVADFFIFGDMLQDAAPVSLFLGALILLVGFVLYGVATLQARILPRWCGVAFIVALPLVVILDLVVGSLVVGVIWLALGFALWRRRGVTTEPPSRVG